MREESKLPQARQMRKNMTHPEVILWLGLKGRANEGFKFRRQHPVGPYITDFYCAKVKLVIEVDGFIHGCEDRPERDAARDQWFADQGMETMRVNAADIMREPHDIADGIVRYVKEKLERQSA